MKLIIDKNSFDDVQREMLRALIRAIRQGLRESAIEREKIDSIAENLAFSVTTIIDGSRSVSVGGKHFVSRLHFQEENGADTLLSCGSGSFMHEYAVGLAEEIGEQEADTPPARASQKVVSFSIDEAIREINGPKKKNSLKPKKKKT